MKNYFYMSFQFQNPSSSFKDMPIYIQAISYLFRCNQIWNKPENLKLKITICSSSRLSR